MLFNPLPLLVSVFGSYFFFKLKLFPLTHPLRLFRTARAALGREGARSSLALTLAGTLGVGNVYGVALGIIVGGAGSVFWLFISTAFAAIIKYSEVVTALDFGGDGMIDCISGTFGRRGKRLSLIYSAAVAVLALAMGAALQSASAADAAAEAAGISRAVFGICLSALAFFTVAGGGKVIKKLTALVIPVSTVIYIFIMISIIAIRFSGLGKCLSMIVEGAFSFRSATGGVLGFLTSSALREGYSRGILSNEAGCGSSTIAHSVCRTTSAAEAGVLGIIEVVFDTAVLCMLTALGILLSIPDTSLYVSPMALILDAVRGTLGAAFVPPVLFSVFCFAFSTVICWYYYGEVALGRLVGGAARPLLLILYPVFVLLGSLYGGSLFVGITDLAMLVMTVFTLLAITKRSDRVRLVSERDGLLPITKVEYETGERRRARRASR